jgi:acetylornithine deacetylase/succinyl-diaminopimelate desuccinylase-like protein
MRQHALEAAQDYAQKHQGEELSLLRELARIPAPSHHEGRRAAYVASWLKAQGATKVDVTPERDVLCWLGEGRSDSRPLEVFAAHLDIAFSDSEPLPVKEDKSRLFAPGVGDDTANLAGLLMATRYLIANPHMLPADTQLLIVADSCEEGLGNLAGTRSLFDRLQGLNKKIAGFVTFDLYLPQCISVPVGSHRFRISVAAQGGHSYHNFGRPNAIEVLCGIIEHLYHDRLPEGLPAAVTYNIGRIEGGTTVNAIAEHASALYEYRSTSEASLSLMYQRLKDLISREQKSTETDITLERIGTRPGASTLNAAPQKQLSSTAAKLIRAVSGQEPNTAPASTDANIPLSLGIPAICVGTIRGAMLHTRKEWVDKSSLADGLALILCLMTETKL